MTDLGLISPGYLPVQRLYPESGDNIQRTIEAEHRKTIKIRYICNLGLWNCQRKETG